MAIKIKSRQGQLFSTPFFFMAAMAFFAPTPSTAQEIKSTVQIVAPRVQLSDKQILITLQNAAQQFINTRKWTDETLNMQEKIEISLFFDITAMNNNDFSGTLQFQIIRPTYNATYKTTIFQFNDEDISFSYREFENLEYQENANVSDFTALLAYYVNIALGMDFDSFGEMAGSPYFSKAQSLVGIMSNVVGWRQGDGKGIRNRYYLSENLTNARFKELRLLTYNYHRKGMDQFSENPDLARKTITDLLKKLKESQSLLQNCLLQKSFFSTKWPELVEIYKGATVPEKAVIVKLLTEMDPTNSQRYEKIKG
ncbi:MAG: DUF4835 family protein [Flavobacteriaceae bacterium]|nr:DUF4835 family protein [Flavobacteriaceae bacterium]